MRANRHLLWLIVLMTVFVGLPVAASERTMYVEYLPKAEFDHGRGFDATALEVMGPCVEGTVKTLGSGSQSVSSEMSQVETTSQLDESLGIGAAASLGYGSFSMSAAAKYAQSHSVSSFTLTYAAKSQIDSATLALDSPRLKEEFRGLSLAAFRDKCGDYYVDGITTGGSYVAMVTISTQSAEDKQQVAAQMSAAINMVGSASLSVDFDKTMQSVNANHEMKITEIRKGGAGEPIAVDAKTMVENFRNFAHSVAEKPAYYEVILKKYSTLPNYPFDTTDPYLEPALGTIETLADLSHSWGSVLNDINVFKAHPKQFRGDDPNTLATWESDVRAILNTLSGAIRTCAGDYRSCSVPALTKQPGDYRSLYPQWKPDADWVQVDVGSGAVRQVAAGSKEMVWALVAGAQADPAGGLAPRRLNGNVWSTVDGGLTSVSVGADGSVWGINSAQDVFRWQGNKWEGVSAPKLVSISVESGNNVVGVNTSGEAVRWAPPNWAKLDVAMRVEQIALGSDGWIALRSGSGDTALIGPSLSALKRIDSPNPIMDIALANRDTIYVIDVRGDLFTCDDTGKLGESLGKFTKVAAAADGSLWAVNGQGQLFRLDRL